MNNRRTTNYWPGFVDALSNMVLAMLFVILVLALAMGSYATVAADAMAKRLKAEVAAAAMLQNAEEARAAEVRAEQSRAAAEAAVAAMAARAEPQAGPAAPPAGTPPSALAQTSRIEVAANDATSLTPPSSRVLRVANTFVLEFPERTVALDDTATKALREALRPARKLLESGAVDLIARAPGGNLTESRQASFYRAMAVRNVLLDAGMTADRIKVLVPDTDELEGKLAEVRLVFRAAAP